MLDEERLQIYLWGHVEMVSEGIQDELGLRVVGVTGGGLRVLQPILDGLQEGREG
jgi:hypothetical protein